MGTTYNINIILRITSLPFPIHLPFLHIPNIPFHIIQR